MTMSKPTFKITRSIRSEQVLNTFLGNHFGLAGV
jgi:hypothetical protein